MVVRVVIVVMAGTVDMIDTSYAGIRMYVCMSLLRIGEREGKGKKMWFDQTTSGTTVLQRYYQRYYQLYQGTAGPGLQSF